MRKWLTKKDLFEVGLVLIASLLSACSSDNISGPINVMVIRSHPGSCNYDVGPVPIQTLDSLQEMRGQMGRVVYHNDLLDSNDSILQEGTGFRTVDTHFSHSGDIYGPADTASLFSASLYYAVENSYLMFKRLNPEVSDMQLVVPNLSSTLIVHEARVKVDDDEASKKEIHDNAAYVGMHSSLGNVLLNYFLSFPNDTIKDIPLGLNLGVFAHEYTHLVFNHLFRNKQTSSTGQLNATITDQETSNTIDSLDEGIADYFGFMATQDPGFFNCSYPGENRHLAMEKLFSSQLADDLKNSEDYDVHEGGAIWAYLQYAIGNAIGDHEAVAKVLIKLMPYLLDCPDTQLRNSGSKVTFTQVAKCEQRLLESRNNASVQALFRKALGPYGGGL